MFFTRQIKLARKCPLLKCSRFNVNYWSVKTSLGKSLLTQSHSSDPCIHRCRKNLLFQATFLSWVFPVQWRIIVVNKTSVVSATFSPKAPLVHVLGNTATI